MLARLQHDEDVRMYYPDVAVYCGHTPTGARTLENPTVVVEVLSPSTQNYDRTEKRAALDKGDIVNYSPPKCAVAGGEVCAV